jgi:hypothetical protein
MINFIVVGKKKGVLLGVLQAIRSFTDAKAVVVGDQESRRLRWSNLCAGHTALRLDGSDDEKFVALVSGLVKKTPHMILIPADCDGIRLTNRVRSRLPLHIAPAPDSSTVETLQDMRQFHQFCRQQQLAVPATCYVDEAITMDFQAIASELGVPFVVRAKSPAGLPVALVIHGNADLKKVLQDPAFQRGSLVCQRHMEGTDVSMSLLADRGQITAFAIEQRDGSQVHFVSNAALEGMAAKLCRASAYNGAMHLSARIDSRTDEVFLIRATPHFPATLAATVLSGLNMVAESIKPTSHLNGVRRLTAGIAHECHPLLRPALWPCLLSDSGERGRLLRGVMFDIYTLCNLARTTLARLTMPMRKDGWASREYGPIRALLSRKSGRGISATQVS